MGRMQNSRVRNIAPQGPRAPGQIERPFEGRGWRIPNEPYQHTPRGPGRAAPFGRDRPGKPGACTVAISLARSGGKPEPRSRASAIGNAGAPAGRDQVAR
ncbi:hypothetical protein BraRD5C2_77160 [Bradyrhizobium sp. RD5-C2]|nr:hypothetical protein BraRD5C2_77160 [Bradyrhizobium sp. RD5-C2]